MKALLRKPFRALYYSLYGKTGKKVTINSEEYTVSAHIARGVNPTIDETPHKLLTNLCRNANVVFDLGANVGIISVLIAKVMKPGSVIYSFEPFPGTFKILTDNARVQTGNATMKPFNLAISNNNGELYFTNRKNHTTNTILEQPEPGCVVVKCATLDSFCPEHKVVPQVIKVDVEGAEYFVLEGMVSVLKNNNCSVVMEIHRGMLEKFGISTEKLAALLDTIGYTLYNKSGEKIPYDQVMKNACVVFSKTELPKDVFNI